MSMTGWLLVVVYVLPFLAAIGVAWKKNPALCIALAACTLFASLVLIALYTTMIFGLLLPWLLLAYSAFGMKPRAAE